MEDTMKYFFYFLNDASGIRTHVPVTANGFQDRLVMTNFDTAPKYKKIDYLPKGK